MGIWHIGRREREPDKVLERKKDGIEGGRRVWIFIGT